MSVNEKERYHLELRHLNASIVSEEFEIKLSEPVELTPEKTYEELNISSAKLAGNTLQISGTITQKSMSTRFKSNKVETGLVMLLPWKKID